MQRPTEPLELALLGPLRALVTGEPVQLGPPKQRALLVQLAVRAGEAPAPIERLIDDLWPEAPPASARDAVQVYVSGLRKALRDSSRVVASSGTYALRLEPGELDLDRFRSLVADARTQLGVDPDRAATRLREALSLWRGRALADLDTEPGVRDVVNELEEERVRAEELLFEAELAAGRHLGLVPRLERLLAEHPAREPLYAHLMLALYRSGRQADALEVYRRARTTLTDELGLEPSPKLRGLEAAVLRQDPSLTVESPELRARRHLPELPPLEGREREPAEIAELVASGGVRLVTVVGPPGARRTSLAVAAAHRLAASFRDGVWYVETADAHGVVAAVAEALGVAPDMLGDHLRDRQLLLVLDGLERAPSAAATISGWLRGAPGVKVLATSEAALSLYGEHEYDVSQ